MSHLNWSFPWNRFVSCHIRFKCLFHEPILTSNVPNSIHLAVKFSIFIIHCAYSFSPLSHAVLMILFYVILQWFVLSFFTEDLQNFVCCVPSMANWFSIQIFFFLYNFVECNVLSCCDVFQWNKIYSKLLLLLLSLWILSTVQLICSLIFSYHDSKHCIWYYLASVVKNTNILDK